MEQRDEHQVTQGLLTREMRWNAPGEQLLSPHFRSRFRWGATLGWLLVVTFLLQLLTGALLAMNYAPTIASAWHCVKFIDEDVPMGLFVRTLHRWSTSAMIVVLFLHLARVFVWGAYKRPRQFIWVVGVLLFFCTLAFVITGDILPWDQEAYWAAKVRLGMIGSTPLLGEHLRTLIQGGPVIGNLTLTRSFALHAMILPWVFMVLLLIHHQLVRRHGPARPWWEKDAQPRVPELPIWPGQALKLGIFALLFLVALGVISLIWPAPREAQANPAQSFDARPEWFFMFLFHLHKIVSSRYEIVVTFILPAVSCTLLLAWPFLDRNPHCTPWRRPLAISVFSLTMFGLAGLTIYALANDTRNGHSAAFSATPNLASHPAAGLYQQHCISCHDADGRGSSLKTELPGLSIVDFSNPTWQREMTDAQIIAVTLDGKGSAMPAFRDKISDLEAKQLAAFIRAFGTDSSKPGVPAP
jgi:ubiquinol-cytochrome c reductase cytochrome b subunit